MTQLRRLLASTLGALTAVTALAVLDAKPIVRIIHPRHHGFVTVGAQVMLDVAIANWTPADGVVCIDVGSGSPEVRCDVGGPRAPSVPSCCRKRRAYVEIDLAMTRRLTLTVPCRTTAMLTETSLPLRSEKQAIMSSGRTLFGRRLVRNHVLGRR